jgi:hypothetical protein
MYCMITDTVSGWALSRNHVCLDSADVTEHPRQLLPVRVVAKPGAQFDMERPKSQGSV